MFTFGDKIDVINEELKRRRSKWQLRARMDLDYNDVEQIIRLHISKKWHLWNQEKPLEPWLNRVISRQISNLLRNLYGNFSRPCLRCAANEGGELCSIYKTQCASCKVYADWIRGKKRAHDVKIPLPMENHSVEIDKITNDFIDYDKCIGQINEKMRERLNAKYYEVYKMIYILNMSDEEVATRKRYKKTEDKKRKVFRYKQIENYRKKFIQTAKEIIKEEGFF